MGTRETAVAPAGAGSAAVRRGRPLALLAAGLVLGALLAGCGSPATAASAPPPSRVGYDRLQQSYAIWQLLDRAREATSRLQSWREEDPETGSIWDHALPDRSHYRTVGVDGRIHEGYESEETDCWRREDGRWDRRPISRRPPAAAAFADDLFDGAVRIFAEGPAEIDGVPVQVVRFSQRAGGRRWWTLAQDREVRVWLAVDDALPRRVEMATPNFRAPEHQRVRLLSHFNEPLDVDSPCR